MSETIPVEYVFSTTDVRALIGMLSDAPANVRDIAHALQYRDFLTVGLLLETKPIEAGGTLRDTWMYIHEPGVRVGRVQLFHNWHPALVADPTRGWVGLEYFVNEGDELWSMDDSALIALAAEELERVGLRQGIAVVDGTVIRQQKAYPAYFGQGYEQFDEVRAYLDTIGNLFPIGRNGMHRYNNQDHSMLAAMTAVDLIEQGQTDKTSIWSVNTESSYHEAK